MKVIISTASSRAKVDKAEEALAAQRRKVENLTVELTEAKAKAKELFRTYYKIRGAKSSSRAKVDKADEALAAQRRKVEDLTVELTEAKAKVKELRLAYFKIREAWIY